MILFINQLLNGIQLGLILFLMAAGLSLVFGIMDFINLAHGSFYMLGAYVGTTVAMKTGSLVLAVAAAVCSVVVVAVLVEHVIVSRLYRRDHLDHVLATFGIILCFDSGVKYLWGPDALSTPLPAWLNSQLSVAGIVLPAYRVLVVGTGLLLAAGLAFVIARTRVGMLVRAAASNEPMARALGVETRLVFAGVFSAAAALAGMAGLLVSPITGTSIGMGNQVVILAFVVIIIGGIGSVRGAFIAALLVGMIDTLGRAYLVNILATVLSPNIAGAAGPAFASILTYFIMTAVLLVKPAGLFPPLTR